MSALPRGRLVHTSMVVVALLILHFLLKLHVVHEHLFDHMPHATYSSSARATHFHHDVHPHEAAVLDALAHWATASADDDDDAESILTLPVEPGQLPPEPKVRGRNASLRFKLDTHIPTIVPSGACARVFETKP